MPPFDLVYTNGMMREERVIDHIRQAFTGTPHPGDAFLQGSVEGEEPFQVIAPFKGVTHWQDVDPAVLDANSSALSFFAEGGFRFFLPAYLIADLRDQLNTADPIFHLTNGFHDTSVELKIRARVFQRRLGKSTFMNPRRYGAMTSQDYARYRLSIFTREEARAIVAYLKERRESDSGIRQEEIDSALNSYWRDRAEHAPSGHDLTQYLQAEAAFLKEAGIDPEAKNSTPE